MDQKRNNFLYWKGLNNALEPPDNQIGEKIHSKRYYLSSVYRKVVDDNTFYKLNAIWFNNHFEDNIGAAGHKADSDFFHSEFQYTTRYMNQLFTFGVSPTYNNVSSDLFGSHTGFGLAVYVQDEIMFSKEWLSTLGARLDYFDIDDLGSDYQLNPRIGLVYKPVSGTSLRASAGTGFRAPSMAEAFTSTEAGGLPVRPNENLKAEKSITTEMGWNQELGSLMNLDISIFYNRFWELIEGGFYKHEGLDYIRFENVTDARISGLEIMTQSWILRNRLSYNIGYTFIDPQNLNSGEYLNYRPRHLLYNTVQAYYRNFHAGLDYRIISRYDRIDEDFGRFIKDYDERVSAHIIDIRFSGEASISNLPIIITAQINNLFQFHHVDLIGSIAPIRNYVFTIDIVF
jgi:outer membrane receptor protein involved in Fe transport